ncbi:hypothetical protein D3C76_1047650 [compost metagenome]
MQVLKTLSTADHQCIQAFRFDPLLQGCRGVLRQLAAVQLQILDTSTCLAQTLSQQFTPALPAQNQHTRIRPGESLAQTRKLEQGFAVVALLRKAHVHAVILKNPCRRAADAKPLHTRCLRAKSLEQFDADSRSGLADHNHRTVAIELADHFADCVRDRDRHYV